MAVNAITRNLRYHEKFVGMRGCQSIFSIICKQNKVYSISASECEWAEFEGGRRWDHLKNYPLLAKRDKKYNYLKVWYFKVLPEWLFSQLEKLLGWHLCVTCLKKGN